MPYIVKSITLDKLILSTKHQPINLKPNAVKAFGFRYHDPQETLVEEWRFH